MDFPRLDLDFSSLASQERRVVFRVMLHLPLLSRKENWDGEEATTLGIFSNDPGLNKGDTFYIANYRPFPKDKPIDFEGIVTKRAGTLIWNSEDKEKCIIETRILVEGANKEITTKLAKLFAENHPNTYFEVKV